MFSATATVASDKDVAAWQVRHTLQPMWTEAILEWSDDDLVDLLQ